MRQGISDIVEVVYFVTVRSPSLTTMSPLSRMCYHGDIVHQPLQSKGTQSLSP
jgi:hypothetical protein